MFSDNLFSSRRSFSTEYSQTMKILSSAYLGLLLAVGSFAGVRGDLDIPFAVSAVRMVQEIAPTLTTSKIKFTGRRGCARLFLGGRTVVPGGGFPDQGLALSTGRAASLKFQNNNKESRCWNKPGDEDLTALSGRETFDACTLEFEFDSDEEGVLSLDYVFASDEYNDVDVPRDLMGLFLNGENIAHIPGTTQKVSIESVNRATNVVYYVDNDPSDYGMRNVPYRKFEPNGFTKMFSAKGETIAGKNRLKLTIADTMDCRTDSWVLIRKNSIKLSSTITLQSIPVSNANTLQISLPVQQWKMAEFIASSLRTWNVKLTGRTHCARLFTAGGIATVPDLPFPESGLILSTGRATAIKNQNDGDENQCWGEPGDTDLADLIGAPTRDACVLEFDFDSPEGNDLSFEYVFASNDYNEYVNSPYVDAFAFFLNEENIAVVPGTEDVTVGSKTVNGVVNSQYYVDNDPLNFVDVPYPKLDADGFTTKLTATGQTVAGTNHMKLVIADTKDCFTDSWVLIEEDSFSFI